jgi:hypothetical protein
VRSHSERAARSTRPSTTATAAAPHDHPDHDEQRKDRDTDPAATAVQKHCSTIVPEYARRRCEVSLVTRLGMKLVDCASSL